jgi:periplasmic protein TonB
LTLHVATLVAPVRHSAEMRGTAEERLDVDVVTETATLAIAPEPAAKPPTPPLTNVLTAASPVLRGRPAAPRDANLAPAPASSGEVDNGKMPRFTITIGAAADATGVVSPSGSAQANENDAEAVSENAVDGQARLLRGVAPGYPDAARLEGIEGDVLLELVVGPSGAVESARVIHGMGHGLDESALSAAKQFRFAPASKGGHAVRVRMAWSIEFRLQ